MKKLKRIFYLIGMGAIFLAALGVIYITFLLVQRDGFVQVKTPFETQDTVKRGEELHYVIHYLKKKDVSSTITRTIECTKGNLVTLTTQELSNMPRGTHTFSNAITIPEKTSVDTCILAFTLEYQLNPLKKVIRRFESEPFEVVE